jgi:ubiquinone/menaquinone biosynthesis C-methylase UbiE
MMSRIFSTPGDKNIPVIDKKSVADFFEKRADKISTLGAMQAVIYQDKNPTLAASRNAAEKAKLLPLLRLNGSQRVLDVGCGTGRWANDLLPLSAWYHGIDACEGFVIHAREKFTDAVNARFTTAAADAFSLELLNENTLFDRVLCSGVLIYLNDEDFVQSILCMAKVIRRGGLILLREPLGVDQRLTISEHYSEDMDQTYNAIYRTGKELLTLIRQAMPESDFKFVGSGDVYTDPALNNRSDTKQQWLLLERT